MSMGVERRANGERRRLEELPHTTIFLGSKSDRDREAQVDCLGEFADVEGLVVATLQHDMYTRTHLLHTNRVAADWLELLQFDNASARAFLQAALLHDAGKILVPEHLLMAPRRLEPAEYAEMQLHVVYGARLLSPYPRLRRARRIVEQHHEWYDGRGYPNGFAGEEIDTCARALSVLDAFSAMTVDRPYHRAISDEDALAELQAHAGTQFDPVYVESFVTFRRSAIERGVA